MRTTEKDILWLCKGNYDTEKYPRLEDALDFYYRKYYDVSKEYIPELSYEFMIDLWMSSCVNIFLNEKTKNSFMYYVIRNKSFKEKYEIGCKNKCKDFYEVLFWRIVLWMRLLQVKNEENWIIDLSEYHDLEENII